MTDPREGESADDILNRWLGEDPTEFVARQAHADGVSLAGWITARQEMTEQDEPATDGVSPHRLAVIYRIGLHAYGDMTGLPALMWSVEEDRGSVTATGTAPDRATAEQWAQALGAVEVDDDHGNPDGWVISTPYAGMIARIEVQS